MLLVLLSGKTIHLNKDRKWYSKRRPKLQLDILSCLILRGKLSKGETESILNKGHPDILRSFNILEKRNFIIKKDRKSGRGRIQYRYEITSMGVEALINDEFTDSLNFWKIMYGFCHHYNKKNDTDQIDRFFDLFYKKYLHYSNRNFLSLHDIFNNMSRLWLKDHLAISNGISPEQKILEVLSINPPLTASELEEKTKLHIDNINKILYRHTVEYFTSKKLSDKVHVFANTTQKQNEYYSLFLRHNLIKVNNEQNNITKYELSLFGIILVITLIRYYNIKNNESYYFNQFTFVDYFDKIVKNYREKVPLIFGKWKILKEVLKNYAIYNFDLIIDTNDIFKETQISLSLGGSKELYHGIKEIILQTRIQLGEFADNGDTCRSNYLFDSMSDPGKEMQNDSYLSKNFPVIQENGKRLPMAHLLLICFKITKKLNPLEFVNAASLNKLFYPYNKNFNEIGSYEEMFAEEISAIYYFNLYNERIFDDEFYSLSNNKTYNQMLDIIPKKCLFQILTADNEINKFYLKWKNDIITLYKNIFDDINNLFD